MLPHCTRCRYFLVFELATWEIIYHATFSAPTDNSEPSCLFTNLEISLFKNCFGIQILASSKNQRRPVSLIMIAMYNHGDGVEDKDDDDLESYPSQQWVGGAKTQIVH